MRACYSAPVAAIEIEPITLPGGAARFVKAWWPIHRTDPHWVPPLIFERKQFLHPDKNPYFRSAEVQCFLASREGRPLGTISAQIDRAEADPGVGSFGFFEFVDDEEIAGALLGAAKDWLRARGKKVALGPSSFSQNHEFGVLIDGFDTDPCVLNPHNPPYYPRIYEAIGLEKAMDWYAYWMDKGPVPERVEKVARRFMERQPNFRYRPMDMKRFEEEALWIYDIYNDAWSDNWGHVHLSREEVTSMAKGMKAFLDPRLVWWAFDGEEPVGVSITLPDVNQIAKPMNGRLLPLGWIHWVFGRKKIDAIRVFALGIKKEYQHLPLGAPLYLMTWLEGMKLNIRGAEASLILETNTKMRGALEKLNARIYKTYRTYRLPLD